MRDADKDRLIQAAIKCFEDAQARYDELMPVAYTVPAVEREPDDPALRGQRREAKGARDEAWRDLKELLRDP